MKNFQKKSLFTFFIFILSIYLFILFFGWKSPLP